MRTRIDSVPVATVAVIVAALVSVATFVAGDISAPAEKPQAEMFAGMIRTLDADKRAMTVEAPPLSKTFGIASNCEIVLKDKPKASLEDLAIGLQVNVTYEDVEGLLVARRIEETGPPPAGKLEPSESPYLSQRLVQNDPHRRR